MLIPVALGVTVLGGGAVVGMYRWLTHGNTVLPVMNPKLKEELLSFDRTKLKNPSVRRPKSLKDEIRSFDRNTLKKVTSQEKGLIDELKKFRRSNLKPVLPVSKLTNTKVIPLHEEILKYKSSSNTIRHYRTMLQHEKEE